MAVDLHVREVLTNEHGPWRTLVATAAEGSPYITPEYLSALTEATGGWHRLLGVFRNDELCGGIGLYEESTPLFQVARTSGLWGESAKRRVRRGRWTSVLGPRATTRLLLYYNGPCVAPCDSDLPHRIEKHRRPILAAIEEHLRMAGYRSIRFKTRHPNNDYRVFMAHGWNATPVYSYVVDLSDLDQLWQRMDNNLRRLVRRCDRQGWTFSESGCVDAFLQMHRAVHQRKDAPLYLPDRPFKTMITKLISLDIARLFQVSHSDGTPAASQLVLFGGHPVTHTLSAGSHQSDLQSGCNAWLRWRVFQWLSERGFTANDLTDAHNPRVARFKSQLGATLELGLQLDLPQGAVGAVLDRVTDVGSRAWRKATRRIQRTANHDPADG